MNTLDDVLECENCLFDVYDQKHSNRLVIKELRAIKYPSTIWALEQMYKYNGVNIVLNIKNGKSSYIIYDILGNIHTVHN